MAMQPCFAMNFHAFSVKIKSLELLENDLTLIEGAKCNYHHIAQNIRVKIIICIK